MSAAASFACLRLTMTHESFLRIFRPRIPQRDRPVPHLFFKRGIWIERKIAEPLKLIALFSTGVHELWFAFCIRNFQRVGIDERFKITGSIGFGDGEQAVIQSNLCIDRLSRADPMNSPFYFATSSRSA